MHAIKLNTQWVIEYYVTTEGKSPVKEFIASLSPESKAKYIFIADLLEEYGIGVKEPYVKPMEGRRKLLRYELKTRPIFIGFSILRSPVESLSCCMALQRKRKRLPERRLKLQ